MRSEGDSADIEPAMENHSDRATTKRPATLRRGLKIRSMANHDLIFAMENKHKQRLLASFRGEAKGKDIFVLEIPELKARRECCRPVIRSETTSVRTPHDQGSSQICRD